MYENLKTELKNEPRIARHLKKPIPFKKYEKQKKKTQNDVFISIPFEF